MKKEENKNFTKLIQKKGLSLIVLIVTIIVIIILAAVVILTISKNKPIENAKEATFKEDVRNFQADLAMTVSKQYTDLQGQRDTKINTSDFNEMKDYIPSFTEKYKDKFVIENDELVGTKNLTDKEKEWAEDLNIATSGIAPFDAVKWDKGADQNECFYWDKDGVTITGFKPEKLAGKTTVRIPSKCTKIRSDYAFLGEESYRSFIEEGITVVEIPETVTEIGQYAFHDFTNLESINIPSSVTSIGYYAFDGCSSLTNITIPDSVTSIGRFAFSGCSSLTNITIPDSVTSIGDNAFQYCSSLTNITIPDSVTSIGDGAFCGCSSLTNITIPDSVTSIGSYAFGDCSSLTNIKISNNVTSIGYYAFEGCSSLTNITIPNSVTSIEWCIFEDCSSLTNINFKGTMNEWNNIRKSSIGINNDFSDWKKNSVIKTITCTDGVINLP